MPSPRPVPCAFEGEGEELRAHAGGCPECADLLRALDPLGAEPADVPPDAARVWWRAQRRARMDAAREAAHPVRAAHRIALASVVSALGTLGWLAWERADAWLPTVSQAAKALPPVLVGVAAVAGLVLIPVAVYLTLSKD